MRLQARRLRHVHRSVIGGIVVFARLKDVLIHFATRTARQARHDGTRLLEAKAGLPESLDGDWNLNRDRRTVARGGYRTGPYLTGSAFNDDRYFAERGIGAKTPFELG